MSAKIEVPSIIEDFIQAYNAMDVDAMMACLHDDVEFENVSNYHACMSWQGREAIRTLVEASAAAFASRRQTILRAVSNGNDCAMQVEFAGVPLIDLPNGMKEGEAAILRGASFFSIKDGKIILLSDFS